MIKAAETFLQDVAGARAALTQASRSIRALEAGEGSSVERVRTALSAADEAIGKVDGSVPRLAIIFPTLGRRTHVYESAGAIVVHLKEALMLLNHAQGGTDEDRQKLEETRQRLNYYQAVFAGNAHNQIWRRWFLKSSPLDSIRLWRRGRRNRELEHPPPQ